MRPLRFQDESNVVVYEFSAAEEKDTHEPLTYQEAVACEDGSKWKIKEESGCVQKPRYKARLVTHGFTQRVGIDYNEIFFIVVRHKSIHVILAYTACRDYEREQFDVKMAFLRRNLEEVIYIGSHRVMKKIIRIGSTKYLLKKEFDMKELGEAKKILAEEKDTHEPLTYQEAVACEDGSKWKVVMREKMKSLKKNKT
nr:hypothetical protein [Tanacetum cinerariifolium]